jgi:hypothetical protein
MAMQELRNYLVSCGFSLHRPLQVYPDVTKGSVHRSVLYSAMRKTFLHIIIVICFIACKNPASEKKKTLQNFDSINNELKKIDTLSYPSKQQYESLLQAAWEDNGTQQLYYTLNDFHGYWYDLKSRFCQFAGDSTGQSIPAENEDSLELTNAFFKIRRNDPDGLYAYLHDVIKALRSHTQNQAILNRIEKLELMTTPKLMNAYFTDVPPVAVITILNSFEYTVKNIEFDVLTDYFKNY